MHLASVTLLVCVCVFLTEEEHIGECRKERGNRQHDGRGGGLNQEGNGDWDTGRGDGDPGDRKK